jgi:hypothetical protein
MRNASKCRENQSKNFMLNTFFFENRVVYEITCKKNGGARQVTDDKMAHAHCMLDN